MQDPLAGWPAGPGLSELDFLEDAAGPLLPLGPDDAMLGSASGAQQLQGWDAPPPLAATSSGPSGSGSGGRPQTAEEKLELARAKNREKQVRAVLV